jgi:hypothetical protein
METVRCSICGKTFRVKNFADQMAKIRHHRKVAHPKAFRASVRKSIVNRK